MWMLVFGLMVFLGVHSISIVNRDWRDRMAAKWGELLFKGLYAGVSAVGLVLIVYGYGQARMDPAILYVPPGWLRHLTMLLMLPVFVLFLATYLPGRIKAIFKHPTLVSVKLWALAHLLSNGMLADVLLFGSFLAWAVADRVSVKRRNLPVLPADTAFNRFDIVAIGGGLLLYVVFALFLHERWIGVSPMG